MDNLASRFVVVTLFRAISGINRVPANDGLAPGTKLWYFGWHFLPNLCRIKFQGGNYVPFRFGCKNIRI